MTFSPLSISFYITFLTLMFPSSHVAGGFLDGKGKSKMYQQITFQQTQTSPSKDNRHFDKWRWSVSSHPHPGLFLCIILVSSFFSTWVVMDGRNTIWVCRIPLEVAFEGFVHFSAEAKVLLLVSLSNLFCLVRFCFYQESEEAGLEKHQSQCFFTCIFSLSVLSRMLFLCLCDWLRTWKVWLWQCWEQRFKIDRHYYLLHHTLQRHRNWQYNGTR